ncbi:phytoene/squalene synthase family protein [Actinomadura rudentiformis]|uniref:Squalene synthase n=1 Tax=Actinomadura rudentiformis TaxID=359158 RepID=A0A6H9Z991_9ACTN|nr:squalene/phytoene synthase family protein [Actinomadura rudentiformis]KAB2352225.1 squalene synthase [Actinomadura rudentiformis]
MLVRRWLDAAGIADPRLRLAYTACVRMVVAREGDPARLVARLLPASLRPYGFALVALVAVADDLSDTGAPAGRRHRLDAFADAALTAVAAGDSDQPVLHAVADTFGVWGLSTVPLVDYFEATRRDIDFTGFATYEDLRSWTRAVGGAMLRLGWPIFRHPEAPGTPPAVLADVGEAGQFTDILCDLAVDLREHRLYLPLADLDRFGVEPNDLYAGRWSRSVHALIGFEAGRVRARLDGLEARVLPLTHPAAGPFVRTMVARARLTLDEIVDSGASLLQRPITPLVGRDMHLWLTEVRSGEAGRVVPPNPPVARASLRRVPTGSDDLTRID